VTTKSLRCDLYNLNTNVEIHQNMIFPTILIRIFTGDIMTKEKNTNISLAEQIYDEMFTIIEKRDDFDEVTIQKLRELGAKEELQKAKKVSNVLIPDRGR